MEENKFTMVQIIFGLLFTLSADAGAVLLDGTVIGLAIAPVLQGAVSFATSLWLWAKGNKDAFSVQRQITKQVSNLAPLLPTTATAFLIEVIMHNNPKAFAAASKAAGAVSGKIGKATAGN